MHRPSLTPPKPHSQKLSSLDSVSASELLKALHTLESINIIQEQIDDDLNISFSHKDTFSHQQNHQNKYHLNPNKPTLNPNQVLKSKTPKSHKQTNNLSCIKGKPTQEGPQQNDQYIKSASKTSKMNFQFYMSKKQNNTIGLKNRSKSPRPSNAHDSKNATAKTFQTTLPSTFKKGKENLTPRAKTSNYVQNKTMTPGQKLENRHNSSVSPLTERSMNATSRNDENSRSTTNKDVRLKTETNERESYSQKRHTKTSSNLLPSNNQENFNKTNVSHFTNYKETKTLKQLDHESFLPAQNINKKPRPSNTLQNLSMLQRNKEYLRQKNQRLAKLCQQMEEKKRQEEKQCTFKPKILTDNSNIKPKYNDLCVSRELMEKGHKKCKQGKQNAYEQECVNEQGYECGSKTMRCEGKFGKTVKEGQKKPFHEEFDSRVNENSESLEDEKPTVSAIKSKYKNSKFNILLDLIH